LKTINFAGTRRNIKIRRMKKVLIIGILAVLIIPSVYSQVKVKPIISSHNFSGKSELWESIGNGILNYQADVMYIYGKLYVTSLMPDSAIHKLPTLTEAYLYPLYNQFKKNAGEIIPGYSGDVFLILNFTTQPIQIYKHLVVEMRPFSEMLSSKAEGSEHQGKIRILIKDKNQLDQINGIKPSFLGLVGGLSDIEKNVDSGKMPLIDVDFSEITSWKGTGNIPFEDFVKIKDLVTKVHGQNKKISFTNCPNNKTVAELIQTSKADFINTQEATQMAGYFEGIK
jgi:hypothetical protein